MSPETDSIVRAMAIGIGASLVMDLWNLFLKRAFGLGIAASRTPKPTQARLKGLGTHTVFGVGLNVRVLGVNCV